MFFKNIMKWLILITIFIAISSNSWFIFWLMMEMNLLMFIPIMNTNKMSNSNSMISYFIIQSFSSSLFFLGAMNFFIFQTTIFKLMMMFSIMIKLALIPFHFWLTSLSEMIDYPTMFLILTIQKFIPLFIIFNIKMNILFIIASISSLLSSLFALNSKAFKKILVFSSISHQGWLISLILMKSNFWFSYMIVYSMLIFKITYFLKKFNANYSYNLFVLQKNSLNKISMIMMMMSLGGMPPFLGFFIKLISIMILIKNWSFIIIILIISSMINIYFYICVITPSLFLNLLNMNNLIKIKPFFKNFLINLNVLITIFILNMLMF
uniref:NADH dehydrogenase subunit 2 n=1 Tax=Amblyomma parvitarsum TaxID=260089 RepID=UPI002E792115|nr:NADH dehydrogenase subunit 2 [Amblyomma parvitarsum]WQF69030.1 NADH dehydrogenase subunit 2 [Amblyomma parvitarsum]